MCINEDEEVKYFSISRYKVEVKSILIVFLISMLLPPLPYACILGAPFIKFVANHAFELLPIVQAAALLLGIVVGIELNATTEKFFIFGLISNIFVVSCAIIGVKYLFKHLTAKH